jgi:hypothetical protein
LLYDSFKESHEERVGLVRAGQEFWMVLRPQHERMIGKFCDLDQPPIG